MAGYPVYRRKNSFSSAIVIVLIALVFSSAAWRDLFGLRSGLGLLFYPCQWTALAAWNGVTGVPSTINNLRYLAAENRALGIENRELKAQLLLLEEIKIDNQRLRQALGFSQSSRSGGRLRAARVIGKSPSPWFNLLQIDLGSNHGVRVHQAVINKQGLVGQIVEVSPLTAKVRLVTDANSSVAGVDSRSRDYGLITGSLTNKLYLKYVSAGADIAEGDLVTTARVSAIFPPGIPVATVVKAKKVEHDLFFQVSLKPIVDFSKLEEVFIVH